MNGVRFPGFGSWWDSNPHLMRVTHPRHPFLDSKVAECIHLRMHVVTGEGKSYIIFSEERQSAPLLCQPYEEKKIEGKRNHTIRCSWTIWQFGVSLVTLWIHEVKVFHFALFLSANKHLMRWYTRCPFFWVSTRKIDFGYMGAWSTEVMLKSL